MKLMNREEVIALFAKEAVLIHSSDAVPFYRAIELFGKSAVEYTKRAAIASKLPGRYYNRSGSGGDIVLEYLTREGFLEAAGYHNAEVLRSAEMGVVA